VSASSEPEPPSMRERYRAQVRREVKEAALRQLAAAGPGGLSISAIGKQLGVSGPALYRYFASRDDLLTELVIDAYQDLANALTEAAGQAPNHNPRNRFEALARAYRHWAVAEPHRYQLLFGPPLPGYEAHAKRLVEASWGAMAALFDVLREFGLGPVGSRKPSEPLTAELTAWARNGGQRTDPDTALHAVLIWSQLHGIVGLEITGNFASMGIPADQLFEIQLTAMTATLTRS
jgi:AcrR family transcriptional regulator